MGNWEKQKGDIKKLLKNTIKLLDYIKIEPSSFSLKMSSSEIKKTKLEINNHLKEKFSGIDFDPIYCIQLMGNYDCKNIASSFNFAKINKLQERCYSKYNHNDSNTLYVGISQRKNLSKRIREHIGEGSKTTYALNLKYWIPDNTQIEILIYKPTIPEYNKENHLNLRELIEQSFWDELKPMMGKRSGQL